LSDNEIVERVLGGDADLFQLIIWRHNRRLRRVAWAIVQDEHEAEDVVQETYVLAYEHLAQFAGRSRFSTWLTRIAIQEAWKRMKFRNRQCEVDATAVSLRKAGRVTHTPEDDLLTIETRTLLKRAITVLPEDLRSVFVMRTIQEMSAAEVANRLEITEQVVNTRFLRARHILLRALYDRAPATGRKAFPRPGEGHAT
jgi:RNA polymerase sigma-70 factor (ECF subfamily)